MDRRRFLEAGAATLAGLALPKLLNAQSCGAGTVEDRYGLGPFYTANAPRRAKLARDIEPGQRIIISGTAKNCAGPLRGVNLDLWQATHSGCYKHPNDACPDIPNNPEQFRLRGQVATDAEGRYGFETIMPGAYLNGSKYRPQHIHCILTIPGQSLKVTTQLYFQGDKYIPGDYAADHASAANRTVPITKHDSAPWEATWDILLPGGVTGIDAAEDAAFAAFDVGVRRSGDRMRFHIPSIVGRTPVEMRLYDARGILLKRTVQTVTPLELDVGLMLSGTYVAELGWWTDKGLRKEAVPFHL
jgi:protocatechuate 3,4-dioxygenase beta subunit